MARKDSQKQNKTEATESLDGNVDQIRQILFGSKMRDYEERFAELEQRIGSAIDRLNESVERRFDRLEKATNSDLQKLKEQLKSETQERVNSTKETSSDVDGLGRQVEGWFAEVEEQMESEVRQLRASIKVHGDEFHSAVDDLTSQASSLLGKDDLAAIFSEVGMRLKKDAKPKKR